MFVVVFQGEGGRGTNYYITLMTMMTGEWSTQTWEVTIVTKIKTTGAMYTGVMPLRETLFGLKELKEQIIETMNSSMQ